MTRMDRLTPWVLAGWLALNLAQAAFTGLLHDEAYYWVFSQYLAWGYKDHPPVTALLIAGSDLLFGGEMGVRFLMVLLSTVSLYLLWRLVRPADPGLFWLVVLAMPILHIGGFVAVPDVPLMAWTLVFFVIWQAWLRDDKLWQSVGLALTLMLLAYTKYHGGLLFFLALLPNLKVLRRLSFWFICGMVGLALVPHLLWQWEHDWLSFRYHLRDRAGDLWQWRFVPEYLGGQIGIWGPLTSVFLWIALFRERASDAFERSLKWVGLGFFLFFFYQSWKQPTEANWTAPVLLPLVWFGYRWLAARPRWATWARRGAWVTLPLLLLVRVYLAWDFLPQGDRPAQEFHRWDEWAQLVADVAGDVPVVFTNRYQRPSKYLFYTRRPAYCVSTNADTGTQFDLFYAMEEAVQGQRVCIVNENPDPHLAFDTIVQHTPSGRPLGFRWRDDFRSYNRVWVHLDTRQRSFSPDMDVTLPVRIHNPTDQRIVWDEEGPRGVRFHYLFIKEVPRGNSSKAEIHGEGLALTHWPVTHLEPGQTIYAPIRVRTPASSGTYRLRFAWEVEGLLRGKNSGFYEVAIE
jgi:4-amino-4-deoxy-L-arabinose transferase-like glycosyltransferase